MTSVLVLLIAIVALAVAVPVSHIPSSSSSSGLDKCTLCKEIGAVVDDAMKQNKTLNEISQVIQDFCNVIAKTPLKDLEPECNALALHAPEIVAWLVDEVSVDSICQFLGACNATVAEHRLVLNPLDLNLDNCTVCQELVSLVESELKQNSTEEKIESVVNELCDALANSPLSELEPDCRKFASSIPIIVNLLLNKENPKTVCTQLHFCTAASKPGHGEREISKTDVDMDDCSICKELVVLGEHALAENKTVDEIRSLIVDICQDIDKTPLSVVSKECNFVADHTDEIVELLLARVNPDGVCGALGMCSAQKSMFTTPFKQSFGVDKCEVCEELVTLAEFELQQNATETKIQTLVNEACAELQKTPLSELYPECELVAKNVPSVVAQLVKLETPQTVCGQLSLC